MIDLVGIVVLAGGESSRMGSPKALLKLPNGERLIDFHIRHAKNLNVPVMVADNGKNFYQDNFYQDNFFQDNFSQDNDVTIIDDYVQSDKTGKGAGALSAIASAMQHLTAQDSYLLVVSCDSLLGADWVFERLQYLACADVMYVKGERDYPLLGLYRTDLLPQLRDYLDKDKRSVMQFLNDKELKTVALLDDWVNLANFNTLDEFNLALKQLPKSNQWPKN